MNFAKIYPNIKFHKIHLIQKSTNMKLCGHILNISQDTMYNIRSFKIKATPYTYTATFDD